MSVTWLKISSRLSHDASFLLRSNMCERISAFVRSLAISSGVASLSERATLNDSD